MLTSTHPTPTIDAFGAIDSLDFEQIAFKANRTRLKKHADTQATSVDQDIQAYKNFLKLVASHPGRELVPTEEIDEIWHMHILDTQRYRPDCEMIFGQMLEHYPYFGIKDSMDQHQLMRAFAETQALYRETFSDGAYDKADATRCKGHACHAPTPCRCRTPGACK